MFDHRMTHFKGVESMVTKLQARNLGNLGNDIVGVDITSHYPMCYSRSWYHQSLPDVLQ